MASAVPINQYSKHDDDSDFLYEIRKTIHPRAVHGWFAGWRVFFVVLTQLIYYGLPWLKWNDRQAVLFDLVARKFYLFGWVLWPQDVFYLTLLLIAAALALFLFTTLAGRLWCGYTCPQTVYTEMFMWVERRIEGDRLQRIRLDAAPLSWKKAALKIIKHSVWIAIALWTGFTLVGYFTPITNLSQAVLTGQLGPWESFWILFYGFATYGNAGFMREQVCKYMCPYARFQGVMFDKDTLTITYDRKRGEPRGGRQRKADPRALGLGDCIDCGICVQVCPTGIDIRQGLQYECIGCGACIDGCNQVMEKMAYPKGLIRYTTAHALQFGYDRATIWRRLLRSRTLIYGAILLLVLSGTMVSFLLRQPLKVDVIRDRGSLSREALPGVIENVYRLQIMNATEQTQRVQISVSGLPGLYVVSTNNLVDIAGAHSRMLPIRLRAPVDAAPPGLHSIHFIVRTEEGEAVYEHSTFLLPRE